MSQLAKPEQFELLESPESPNAVPETSSSQTSMVNYQGQQTGEATYAMLYSPSHSIAYRIQVRLKPSIEAGKKTFLNPFFRWQSSPTELYEIQITYLRNEDDVAAELLATLTPEALPFYPSMSAQYFSVSDGNSLYLGCVELELDATNKAITFVPDVKHTVFQKALTNFKRISQPFKAPRSRYLRARSPTLDASQRSAIFENQPIVFSSPSSNERPDTTSSGDEVKHAFMVRASQSGQAGQEIFEFVRRIEGLVDGDPARQARQFEVFLCKHESEKQSITWMLHTTSAGSIQDGKARYPALAWASHPHLPLLAWTLPGHKLKLSHTASYETPIAIAGKSLPSLSIT